MRVKECPPQNLVWLWREEVSRDLPRQPLLPLPGLGSHLAREFIEDLVESDHLLVGVRLSEDRHELSEAASCQGRFTGESALDGGDEVVFACCGHEEADDPRVLVCKYILTSSLELCLMLERGMLGKGSARGRLTKGFVRRTRTRKAGEECAQLRKTEYCSFANVH